MLNFLKKYLPFYKKHKFKIIIAILGMIIASASTAAIAYLVKPVLDEIFIKKNEHMLMILPIGIILSYFLKGLGNYLSTYYIGYVGRDIVKEIREQFLAKLFTMDLDFFRKNHSGTLISRTINDIDKILSAVSTQMANLIKNFLSIIFLSAVVIYQNPRLAAFLLIVVPLIVIPVQKISKKVKKIAKESQKKTATLTRHLSEIFKNIETIKAYNADTYELNIFKTRNDEFLKIDLHTVKTKAMLIPILETTSALMAAIIIYVGGKEVIHGEMTTGAFFSFLTALFMLTDPIRRLSTTLSNIQIAIAAQERIEKIMKQKPKIISGKLSLKKIDTIEFKEVFLKYGKKTALKNINYKAQRPKIVGLVGDSGGGKSSFVSLILRFYDVNKGKLLINNKDIKDYKIKDLREKIAYIPQNVHIFNNTIAHNIAYGKEIDEEKIKEALKKANLLEFVESLPDGIYTKLQENGSNLSGGQRQRIAIARALYTNPDVLILDEATSALDNKSEAVIMKTIENLRDKLIFIVAHRLSTVENADEILVFKEGEIVCRGKKEELLDSCEEFKRLYNKNV
ncbi:ABC transporter ATP-binding protein [Caminibacter pacificus]|uniref:ABC transporter ATP-binding protein n=1 Tax=Caminibacter pacificus TaxID=1424653 RepID=A0AAJ4RBQ8_9BACT|nr:ABC transporter ATP-binding protein [Caminibacter pacificus]QCI29082.1 ABC transporter ATP-binding protein [Caminibacter pacificus]ROR39097.1 subfamily B ATP-binding cassette protein MsbA [Caminibacter pacificus]